MTQHGDKESIVFQTPKHFVQWNLNCRFTYKVQARILVFHGHFRCFQNKRKVLETERVFVTQTNGQAAKEIKTNILKEAIDWVSVFGETIISAKALRTFSYF